MTGNLLLDWATLTVSLFNTILLLWLGLTVLLNAERRTWGIWLAGTGLLMAAAFFVSHTTILSHNLTYLGQGTEFWWRAGWTSLVVLPYSWYVLMLWYGGFWEGRASPLRRRQGTWLWVVTLLTLGLIGLIVIARALPDYSEVIRLDLAAAPAIGGVPLLLVAYPLHTILCIVLALNCLAHPEPSPRVMGDLARRRARPWLIGTSAALLAAGLLVGAVLAGIALDIRWAPNPLRYPVLVAGVAWFDLVISITIAVAVVLLGQAIVSYEIFTGHYLPRRGFLRHWRWAVILSAGYSAVVGWSLTVDLRPVYGLLLTALVMTTFYALLVRRSFDDRDRAIAQLRPFVTSQGLYDHLLGVGADADVDADASFRALCEDVLGARTAYLIPAGSATALMGSPLIYPRDSEVPSIPVQDLVRLLEGSWAPSLPVDPDRYGGAVWAVPLFRERGLIGMLLLGGKKDGGLYTQEEIEIARAGGERLIDIQVSAEMARRLMMLQRQTLAESQIIDQRPRRILHDDVLPRLHAAMLGLQAGESPSAAIALLAETHRQVANLLQEMPEASAPEVKRLGIIGALRQVVEDDLGDAFDTVTWEITPEAEQALAGVPALAAEVVFYAAREAVRNAARYGRDPAADQSMALRIRVAWDGGLVMCVEDNGAGFHRLEAEALASGHGLALHSTLMAVIGGTLEVDSAPGDGTRVILRLPEIA